MVFRRMPGRNILNIKNEIDRIYDEMFANRDNETEFVGNVIPAVNIDETKNEFIISAELPGMDKKEVNITFLDDTLTLSGEKKRGKKSGDTNVHRNERDFGTFSRSFTIPGQIDENKIEASFDKGVLTVLLPKAEAAKEREIKINIK